MTKEARHGVGQYDLRPGGAIRDDVIDMLIFFLSFP